MASSVQRSMSGCLASMLALAMSRRRALMSLTVGATLICAMAAAELPLLMMASTLGAQSLLVAMEVQGSVWCTRLSHGAIVLGAWAGCSLRTKTADTAIWVYYTAQRRCRGEDLEQLAAGIAGLGAVGQFAAPFGSVSSVRVCRG